MSKGRTVMVKKQVAKFDKDCHRVQENGGEWEKDEYA